MADYGKLHVVFICDEAFALPTGVAMSSLLSSRKPNTRYAVHVVACGLSVGSRTRLETLADDTAEIDMREVDGKRFSEITSANVHVSSAALFKFMLPEIFPDLDRVLYLDGDIIVRGDLTPLWKTNLSNAYVAAVEDKLARRFGGKTLKERIGYPHEKYFNSGMMLVNLEAWRRDRISDRLLDYRLHGKNDFMDQDAMNSVLGGRTVFLDARYNTRATDLRYEDKDVRAAKEAEAIIYHYASPEKPWKQSDADNAALWLSAFAASPFSDVTLELQPRSELDTYKRRCNALWTQLERAQRDCAEFRERFRATSAEAKSEHDKAEAEIAQLKKRQTATEVQLSETRAKLEECSERLVASESSAASRLKNIIWLKERQAEVETRLDKTRAEFEKCAENLTANERIVESQRQEIVRLKEIQTKTKIQLAEVEGLLEATKDELGTCTERLASSKSSAAARLKSIVWLKKHQAVTKAHLSETKMRLESTKTELEKCTARLAASRLSASSRLKSIIWLKKQKERLVMEKEALEKRIDENILISVLIPVYNVEAYLRDTLSSVISQGLTNIEIIAVDNCSTDSSLAILREVAATEPRLHVIALPENGGVRASRGAALEAAHGKYVYFLDADDLLEPDILAQAFAAAESGHCDVIQFGHREFRDGESDFFRSSLPNPKCVGADIRANPDILYLQTKYIWDKLFRHQMLVDNDIHIPVYNYMEDHYFLFSVAMKAKNFGILPVFGYRYRRSVATARTRSYTEELLDCSKAYWDIVKTTRKAGLFKELAPSIWRNASECYRWRVLAFVNYDNKELQEKIVKDWFDFFQANYPRWQRNLHMMGIPCHLPPGQPPKVLLLGGTGALGAHLRDILAGRGFEVWVTSRNAHQDSEHIHYLQLDAMDVNVCKKLTASHWDAIVDFMIYKPDVFASRLKTFLEHTDQYVSLSSARVYADAGGKPITEVSPRLLDTVKDETYLKTNEYALAKARDENLLREAGVRRNWTIIRPYVTFSEERLQLGTLEKEHWLKRALAGKPIVFSRDVAERLTTLTYGRDVALGMAALIGRKEALGEVFHITSSKQIRWSEVLAVYVKVLTETLGKAPKVVMTKESVQLETPGKYQVMFDRSYNRCFDNAKIGRFVDVASFRDPKEALESCLRAFLASERKFRPINESLEALHDQASRNIIGRFVGSLAAVFGRKLVK